MAAVNQVGNTLTGATGTGNFVGANTPTLITPVIGAATGTSLLTTGIIQTTSGSIRIGDISGGSADPIVYMFSPTGGSGQLRLQSANNAGAFVGTIINASLGQSSTWTIPDPGASAANFVLRPSALVSGNIPKASGTAGLIIDSGIAASSLLVSGGALTASSLTFSPTTGGIVGTTTNDNVTAGDVGEFVSSIIASGTPVSLTNATGANVTSISLTAGDWDVWGNVAFDGQNTTTVSLQAGWVSTTSATLPDLSLAAAVNYVVGTTVYAVSDVGFCAPQRRFSLSGTTTIYLSVYSLFAIGTSNAYGAIYARRRR